MSNIKVSVEWEQATVFAGEDIRCTITFHNAAAVHRSRSPSPNSQLRGFGSGRDRWKSDLPRYNIPPLSSPLSPNTSVPVRPRPQGHRSTISLSAPVGTSRRSSTGRTGQSLEETGHKQNHNRSVSIVSIGSQNGSVQEQTQTAAAKNARGKNNHARAASFQGLPFRSNGQLPSTPGPPRSPKIQHAIAGGGDRSSTLPFSLQRASSTIKKHKSVVDEMSARGDGLDLFNKGPERHLRTGSEYIGNRPHTNNPLSTTPRSNVYATSPSLGSVSQDQTMILGDGMATNRPLQRILSPTNIEGVTPRNGTPRSSTDIYSHSNHSSETLASEYINPTVDHHQPQPNSLRLNSQLAPLKSPAMRSEVLMMGYVQLVGSFSLDGALVNLAPFESVKRKGVIGGQGSGGVVGVETSKRDSGIFGSLGWNNIGQSLGGLLGTHEPSSIREMKGIASTKSVPILSTPQSILFVDLKLRPGESKSFAYSHRLPQGIPPTHKGRAIKSSYQLVIGTQRPNVSDQQHLVRQVEVPFKVQPGVNESGEILGHDLMKPHVLLQDIAVTKSIEINHDPDLSSEKPASSIRTPDASDGGFVSYVETILHKSRSTSTLSLLSPTEGPTRGLFGMGNERPSTKELIDLAITQGKSSHLRKSANRFQINRDGTKVASVIIARSAYRLGETISAVVDFRNAEIPCYALNVSLETSEIVDPSLALRSAASIHRATRRIHASSSENTVCAQRSIFGSIIPLNATPEFDTTGVRLEWKLRFEFITENGVDSSILQGGIIEKLDEDERGATYAAMQEMPCRSFDVAVPIRVYGSEGAPGEDTKTGIFAI